MVLFLKVFLTEFIAEMGDKTQLMLIALTSKYKLKDIILGTAAAILVLNGMAVLAGGLVSEFIPDWLIKTIAEWLRKASREEEVCMRFGGDEFIVLGLENVADGRHLEFEQEFQNHIRQVNESQKREYPVSASIGSYTIDDVEHTNLQIVIERADMEMYLRKKKKKRG